MVALLAGENARSLLDREAEVGRVRKLSVIDTGTGMTADQLRYYINQLAATGREQSRTGNFGVGAKVTAGSRNPHGLEYRSWHEGQGSLVCFKRHPDGRWGLEPQRWEYGRTDFWRPLDEAGKPWLLRGEAHGTPGARDPSRAEIHATSGRRTIGCHSRRRCRQDISCTRRFRSGSHQPRITSHMGSSWPTAGFPCFAGLCTSSQILA
jgi:hypothetical protein